MTSDNLELLSSKNGAIYDKVLAGDIQAATQLMISVFSVLNVQSEHQTPNFTVNSNLTEDERRKQEEEAAKAKESLIKVEMYYNNFKNSCRSCL